jgi:hypothetical protein
MFEKIKVRIFPFIIALSALSVSASAAFYSVTGLSMLFAGAGFAVMIMASSLEIAKLVIASLLYQYWDQLNKLLKIYLTIAAFVLVLITSAGIYGYLSNAYQKTADQTSIIESKVSSLETKKKLFEETRDNILKEKQSIATLQGTLSQASTTQFTDKNGNLVVRSNNAAIRNIESASKSNEALSAKIDVANDSIFAIESKILEIKTTAVGESELGPLKYLSALTGVTMDRIINWYILVIIFVFDPLAISLVIAANFAFAKLNKREELPLEEKVEGMRNVVEAYDDLQDEMKEWEEASLTDLQEDDVYWEEPNEDLKQAAKEYEIYKEQDQKIQEQPKKEDEWVIEDEDKIDQFDQLFNSLDSNLDGLIDEDEALKAGLDVDIIKQINNLKKYSQDPNLSSYKKSKNIQEIEKLISDLKSLKPKEDDTTITYF